MTRRAGTGLWATGASLILALTLSPPAQASGAAPYGSSVLDLLSARARAIRTHDAALARQTVDPRSPDVAALAAVASNAARVPFATLDFELDPAYGELTRARDGADSRVIAVLEHVSFTGDGLAPAREERFWRIRQVSGRWLLASEAPLDDAGLRSVQQPWDRGTVGVVSAAGVLVLHPVGSEAAAQSIAGLVGQALGDVLPRWDGAWAHRAVVEVPADVGALERRLDATFSVRDYTAFTYATTEHRAGRTLQSGTRVVVQPSQFLQRSSAYQREVLDHELMHAATRPETGSAVPAWLEEGIAQALGEGRTPVGLGVLSGVRVRDLPYDEEFFNGGTQAVYRAYAEGYTAVRLILSLVGQRGLEAFYAELGAGGRAPLGGQQYRIDQAMRHVLGMSLAQFTARWAAAPARDR